MLLAGILAVAANLRPIFTSLGPLIDQVGASTGLGPSALGLLAAMPLLAFALISPVAAAVGNRFGAVPTLLGALVVLLIGALLRIIPGTPIGLWVGSFTVGAAIAVGNVLLPSVVKAEFPQRVALMTGVYTAVLGASASAGVGLAVPLSHLDVGGGPLGWPFALTVWALLVLPAIALWLPQLRYARAERREQRPSAPVPSTPRARGRSRSTVWTSALAWQVTAYMGLQSAVFYILITWLPTIERSQGIGDVESGWHLFAFQFVGVAASFTTSFLLRGPRQRLVAAVAPAVTVVGVVGMLTAPTVALLWALVAGVGSGASLVTALSLIALRTRDHVDASSLSGMSQSLGYLFAAIGPPVLGALFAATGSWVAPLVVIGAVAFAQLVAGLLAGRDRVVGGPTGL
ncbi:hypothetical protein BKD30_07940 [Tersicoccus phoenicis]|uniref:Major facilitator superfamily (MFS) profile domain-containing protein n=1 Tax=Tersicoccus phoenicis TaxID=554083 RepID=A0A1R1LAZ0_9MICC|nr:hypothetical protein BKD30_07940 [Tersicoccus phoenicis]